MSPRVTSKYKFLFSIAVGAALLFLCAGPGVTGGEVHAQDIDNDYLTVVNLTTDEGVSLTDTIIHGPPKPPSGFEAEVASVTDTPADAKTLTVPTYSWVFGCSSVSGAMIAGYYDRNGYANMYTGPTDSGVMPLTDTSWPNWSDGYDTYPNNPLIASHKGVDGRSGKGSIDDYWVRYGSTANDPYITGSWTQHKWGTAIGDYMKTSQSSYNNTDGSTNFFNYNSATKLTCSKMTTLTYLGEKVSTLDGTYGRKLFYQKRGYTVTDCFNQSTDNKYTGGFSLANYKAQINAGNPVLLNLAGHSIVGVGYGSGNTIYIHDTWHSSGNQTMQWGGSYSGMELQSVSVVNLAATAIPTPQSPSGTISDRTPTYKWSTVSGATAYKYQLKKGSTVVYTKTVSSSACTSTTCKNTPSTKLSYTNYKWRVRAKLGGTWKAWSAFKKFTVAKAATGFNSQFNGDASGWTPVYGTWSILNSKFYTTVGTKNVSNSTKHSGSYTTLTYQAKLKRKGCSSCANRLIIRGDPSPLDSSKHWNKEYTFQYNNNGSYSVYKRSAGTETALKGWTTSSAIVKNGWNLLKVTASGSQLKFYINNTLVWSGTDSAFGSGTVGIGMYRDSTSGNRLWVNWAKLATSVADTDGQTTPSTGTELSGGTIDQSP